ncbi:amino acid permease 5-like [Gossypium australe]|uniref:Amino acid permease 5-like n=1 Tax=Gossypium australe TaxID=47621 RepID=A0A5B6WSB7_9ROSI|nr:amino acid permease 5-like [Gossypium australe]
MLMILPGAVLGQMKDKVFHAIYYASRTMTDEQLNYTTLRRSYWLYYNLYGPFYDYVFGDQERCQAKEFDPKIQDKKGNENQVAIKTTISNSLRRISHMSNYWLPRYYLVGYCHPSSVKDEGNFSMMLSNIIGTSHLYSNIVQIKSFDSVFRVKRFRLFYITIILHRMEDILREYELQQKFSNLAFIGRACLKMLMNFARLVIVVNEMETYHEGMECRCKIF